MNVTLTPEQEKFVAEEIRNGHAQTADEVIAYGLELLREQEEFIRLNRDALRKEIQIGLDALDRGEVMDGREAFARLREKNRTPPRSIG